MYIVTLHNTETEAIVGHVTQANGCSMDFNEFFGKIYESFKKFHKEDLDEDYSIEDFVEWHNDYNDLQIDWVVADYIQLSNEEL